MVRDFTHLGCGKNLNVLSRDAEGKRVRVAGWSYPVVEKDDYLLVVKDERQYKYQVESVQYPARPKNMWFADLILVR